MIEMKEGIAAKFARAWSFAENPPLDSDNPHFRNRYASLSATLNEVRRACRMSDIVYMQTLVADGDGFLLKSYVMDENGERLELSTFPVSNVPNPQNFGSDLTYKKRQQAQADWGIAGEYDDDGEAAAAPTGRKGGQARQPAEAKPKDGRLDGIRGLYKQALKAGVKQEGVESWMVANMGCGLDGMDTLADEKLKAVEMYLRGRIADMEAVKADAA